VPLEEPVAASPESVDEVFAEDDVPEDFDEALWWHADDYLVKAETAA
jgi:hypothetical protein